MKDQTQYPAPWKLIGEGIILTYSFSKDWMLDNGFVPPHLQHKFKGGLSFIMMVNYQDADCGPYKELLFIPGLFYVDGKYQLMITKIYVDSEESLDAGRNNWGIPKELAEINWIKKDKKILFNANFESKFFEAEIATNSFVFPVNNTLVPFKFYQEMEGKLFSFAPKGKGKATTARLKGLSCDSSKFPDLNQGNFINCMHVKDFKMTFPKSEIKGL